MIEEERALAKAEEALQLLSDRQARLAEGLQTIRARLFNLKGYLEATGFPRVALTWVEEAIEVVKSLQLPNMGE